MGWLFQWSARMWELSLLDWFQEIYSKDSTNLMIMRADRAFLPVQFLSFSSGICLSVTSIRICVSVIFCDMFGMSMAIFAVHFFYRYLVLSRKQWFKKRDSLIICVTFLFSLIVGIIWSFVTWYTMKPFAEADEFLKWGKCFGVPNQRFFREHFLPPRHLNLDQVVYIGFYYYPKNLLGIEYVHWKSVIGMIIQCLFIVRSYDLCVLWHLGSECFLLLHFLLRLQVLLSDQVPRPAVLPILFFREPPIATSLRSRRPNICPCLPNAPSLFLRLLGCSLQQFNRNVRQCPVGFHLLLSGTRPTPQLFHY